MSRSLIRARPYLARATRHENERGATMAEYAILVVFIAMVALVGVKLLGPPLSDFFTDFAGDI